MSFDIPEETWIEISELQDEIARLRAVMHETFMAMCAYRDNHDEEAFQDAIDLVGLACNYKEKR